MFGALAAAGASLVALFQAFPIALIKTVAGLGLMTSLTGALVSTVGEVRHRFAAVATFAVTASGVAVAGVGAAFWGLMTGLVFLAVSSLSARST